MWKQLESQTNERKISRKGIENAMIKHNNQENNNDYRDTCSASSKQVQNCQSRKVVEGPSKSSEFLLLSVRNKLSL